MIVPPVGLIPNFSKDTPVWVLIASVVVGIALSGLVVWLISVSPVP
jgi:hypothetical protein